ncbi:hypothetical protein CP082626L3_0879B, partial [Chlamydia psittaci 08-2626_L3]
YSPRIPYASLRQIKKP